MPKFSKAASADCPLQGTRALFLVWFVRVEVYSVSPASHRSAFPQRRACSFLSIVRHHCNQSFAANFERCGGIPPPPSGPPISGDSRLLLRDRHLGVHARAPCHICNVGAPRTLAMVFQLQSVQPSSLGTQTDLGPRAEWSTISASPSCCVP